VLSGTYITLSVGKRFTALRMFIFMLFFTLSTADFNVDVIQYIVLIFSLTFWHNYLQFLCSLGGCHAEMQQAYMRFFVSDVSFFFQIVERVCENCGFPEEACCVF
jgi:hypothetical protein